MSPNPQFPVDLVTFTEEILNGKLHFLCSTSHADGTNPYSYAQDISSVISEFQRIVKKVFDWCRNNHMKVNPGKCHVVLSSNTQKGNSLCKYINCIKSK